MLLNTINGNHPVTLRLTKQRFLCKHCRTTFNAKPP
ncbi:hypothetical protein F6I39_05020 [Aerococcus loyolae]|uniref:ISL3 family transposase n=1 Tax=Aerococcus urinae TaxID=1376 RepID=A0A329P4Y7_9LACT|nr:hypothetical protein F6I39_05020 [Aerococcus loyolae]KAA9266681.1 hypothetical protein F6I19_01620 [Aerococcus loyolae]RAV68803.1 hypothetical protein DBT51_04690 [Aerococcus loyolae]RAV80717.1 hypothetical protein DBT54_02715 [Aerococcus loyolae]